MRTPIIAGNWKMNCTLDEAQALASGVVAELEEPLCTQVVVCPPFPCLEAVHQIIATSGVALGAQNMFWRESGAYTGEVSPAMLTSVGCQYVIIGHSERRGRFGTVEEGMTEGLLKVFGDNDETVNNKVKAAFKHDLTPIVCVGELLAEREKGLTDAVVRDQVFAALEGLDAAQVATMVFAYEPVWAIGTGEVCEAEEADRVCKVIRQAVGSKVSEEAAQAMRVQYGGSVKPDNVEGLMRQPDIDGGLVGGASLKAGDFVTLVEAAGRIKCG